MRRTVSTLVLLALGSALGAACDGQTIRSTGSETNWLGSCSDDSECQQGHCLCGICSEECTELAGCEGTSICASNQNAAYGRLCAEEPMAPEGLCLRACDGTTCPANQRCLAGACVDVTDQDLCTSDEDCDLANAGGACDADGHCIIASCKRDFDDCNDDPADGCEANFAIDSKNCDTCGKDCNAELPAGAVVLACVQRGCEVQTCESGLGDCNEEAEDGCEVDLNQDPAHCGECGRACADGQTCSDGVCGS